MHHFKRRNLTHVFIIMNNTFYNWNLSTTNMQKCLSGINDIMCYSMLIFVSEAHLLSYTLVRIWNTRQTRKPAVGILIMIISLSVTHCLLYNEHTGIVLIGQTVPDSKEAYEESIVNYFNQLAWMIKYCWRGSITSLICAISKVCANNMGD